MEKKHKLVLLPTEKAKGEYEKCLWLSGIGKELSYDYAGFAEHKIVGVNKQHLYILSDEEKKDGDKVFPCGSSIENIKSSEVWTFNSQKAGAGNNYCFQESCMKIIATTDSELILPTQDYGKSDYKHLPQIPQDFIEVFIKEYNTGNAIKEVLVEYESEKDDGVLYEISEPKLKLRPNNTIVIRQSKEKMYSREEVINFINKYLFEEVTEYIHSPREWFDKNYPA